VIVLILVAVLWIAVLVPSVTAKIRERRSAGSIGRFHQRLDLLERTGPKLVEPAYRLTGTDGNRLAGDPVIVAAPPPPMRPTLTLLPPPDDGLQGGDPRLEDWTFEGGPDLVAIVPEQFDAPLGDLDDDTGVPERELVMRSRRLAARRRRRNVFGMLCAVGAFTGIIGIAPSMRAAWYVCAICVCLLVAFVALAVYSQRMENERDHLVRLRAERDRGLGEDSGRSSIVKYLSAAEVNEYGWDDESFGGGEDWRLLAEA
jgi:hypothetical protein